MKSLLKLFCLIALCITTKSSSSMLPLCHDNERAALLQFKLSLSISEFASIDSSAFPKTKSWKSTGKGSDCCFWEGIGCDVQTSHITILDLSNSFLTGSIYPNSSLFELVHLHTLNLADNDFRHSLIPTEISHLSNLKYLNLSLSGFSGQVPTEICQLSKLISLDLSYSAIPSSGMNQLTLGQLSLKTLLESFSSLEVLFLDKGQVPRSLAKCSLLKVLDLSSNHVDDTFPTWLQGLPQLHSLLLGSNKLQGMLPNKVGLGFPSLRIIDLSNNKLTGNLPCNLFLSWYAMKAKPQGNLGYVEITSSNTSASGIPMYSWYTNTITILYKGVEVSNEKVFKIFTMVDLSNNNFFGKIPESIGKLVGLEALNLSHNNLIGGIPSSFKNLSNLESLDLSHNMLSEEIPQQLTNMIFLEIFNVSYNNLIGPIPLGNQFNTFGNDSYRGNPGLCGSPLSKKCGNFDIQSPLQPQPHLDGEADKESSALLEWVIISMGYVSGLVIGMILGRIFTTAKHQWFVETFGRRQHKRGAKRRDHYH
ncbi:hypothetical protein Ancab_040418 [Ancistrocladus abbreviatus]